LAIPSAIVELKPP